MKTQTQISRAALIGRMSAAERAAGRFMRAPDGHSGFSGVKNFDDLTRALEAQHGDVKAAFDELRTISSATKARLDELEQKGARDDGNSGTHMSIGEQFIEQDGLKAFADRNQREDRFGFEVKATLTSATTDAAGSVGAGNNPYRDPTITPLPQRRPMMRDLLTVLPMSGGSVEVVKVKGRNNNAAPVAEGAAKPGSDLQLAIDTVPARVIAHWIKASRQVLDDVPQLSGLIDTELMDGLALAEDAQILSGDGTGQNLNGLIPNATPFDTALLTGYTTPTFIDKLGLAMLQSDTNNYPVTGIVLHPADWTRITLLKDGEGRYIFGPPGTPVPQVLFGKPVVTTTAIAVDKFLLGDFRSAATLYVRWTARIEVGTINDDFTRNLLTVLAEERVAQAIKDAKALIFGDFGLVA